MKILVPTDFSKLSKVAVLYAAALCKKLKGEMVLVHAVYFDAPSKGQVEVKMRKIMDTMVENAEQDIITLTKEIREKVGSKLNITSYVVEGHPVENVIDSIAKKYKVDFIVVGTKGASGLKKVLMGSNATAVISNSTIPVITVPEFARFNNFKNIIYASDMSSPTKELDSIINLVKVSNATLHVLHILPVDSKNKFDSDKLNTELIEQYNYPKIVVAVRKSDDIKDAIEEYVADSRAEIIAMFTRKLSFFDRLFGTSVTRAMAFHSWIPILSFRK